MFAQAKGVGSLNLFLAAKIINCGVPFYSFIVVTLPLLYYTN